MSNKVNNSPNIALPIALNSLSSVSTYLTNLVQSLMNEMRDHATRVNTATMNDGSEIPVNPVRLLTYSKTALPSAASYPGALIYVSDDIGGATPAFSNGVNWIRVADRNTIS